MTPVFIFSLPRSGSTLLQRMLAAHSQVDSCAEPWILLPTLYGLREGMFAEYSHNIAVRGIRDAMQSASGNAYPDAVRAFGMTLYEEIASADATHFVDKTPRYHLIVDDIMRAFPEGHFVFLWRNPLSIIASIMRTWSNGSWNLDRFTIDLFEGLPNLISASERASSRVHCVQYEALVRQPEKALREVFAYLNLPFEDHIVHEFNDVGFAGELGDPTGVKQYQEVNTGTTSKWQKTLNNPLRKRWVRRYLQQLGEARLAHMGYNLTGLIDELNAAPVSAQYMLSDLYFRVRGQLRVWLHPAIQRFTCERLRTNKRIYPFN